MKARNLILLILVLLGGAFFIHQLKLVQPSAPKPIATNKAVDPAQEPSAPTSTAPVIPAAAPHAASTAPVVPAAAPHTASTATTETDKILAAIPEGPFRESLMQIVETARNQALTKLIQFNPPKEDYASLRADQKGDLFYVCNLPPEAAQPIQDETTAVAAPITGEAAVPVATPPVRHSRPGSANVLYLDFNGHTITDTTWNRASTNRPAVTTYSALPFDLDSDPTTFSDAEQAFIIQVWERVAEDFAPFNLDVTTEEPANFTSTTGRAVITKSTDANGVLMPSSTAGGVAYLGVFGDPLYATEKSPAFVYYSNNQNAGIIAEKTAHEFGHNLGLSHDGTTSGSEYYNGHGAGETSWGPLMGTGYNRNVSQWCKGEYFLANNTQDDLAIIGTKCPLIPDDAGNTIATAIPLPVTSGSFSTTGRFSNATDIDLYRVTLPAGTTNFSVAGYRAASGTAGGNTDIKLDLLDSTDTVLFSNDLIDGTRAALSYTVTAGNYYVRLTPAGAGNPLSATPTGYTTYGSIGQYTLTGASVTPSVSAFTTQPATQTVYATASVSFDVVATGAPTPTYQWKFNGNAISGATSTRYTIASTVSTDAGAYTVSATNSQGTTTSFTATLTVTPAITPAITTQPVSLTVTVGNSATFTVVATGGPAPTYQWKLNGTAVLGATNATYTIASTGTGNAGSYTVVATNSSGTATSSAASLTVNPGPPVLPPTQMVITGKTVALGIVTPTTGTIKWQVSTDSGSTYTDLADNATYRGTTTAVLEILQVTSALNNNRYRYQVTLSGQTTASTATTLSVNPAYLLMPAGIKIDSANNLYVTDAAAQVIVKITSDFKIASLAGTNIAVGSTEGTGTVARFNEPSDLVINGDGSFLLTDTSNASLRKVTTAGVVTTFAGTSGSKGSTDGTGAAARFSAPVGIARDTAGNVYVADQTNHIIRRVTPAGVVTTLAGTAGAAGSTNGTGAAARFNLPTGVAINSTGVLYVADFGSHTLRKVTAAGEVSTFAGLAGTSGSVDSYVTAARFNKPSGLALDTAGNLYVADTGNSTVRKVSPAGVVTTLAGLSAIAGLKDGTGALAWFNEPEGVTADASGNLYLADTGNAVIRKITPAGVVTTLTLTGTVPVITTQPASVSVTAGNSASFSVVASSEGVLTYQWKKDGTDVAVATAATYAISSTATTSAGSYTVVVSNFLGSVTSSAATLTVNAVVVTAPPSSGGGGGGAVSSWFIGALGLLLLARRVRRRG